MLSEDPECSPLFRESELASLFVPTNYLGDAKQSIDQVLARADAMGIATTTSLLDIAGAWIHFKWSGESDKPVLVLSNSLGADMTMWDAQVEEFSEHFRVLCYDTRGHGQSSKPPGLYTMELLGRDVVAMLDAFRIHNCSFCGLSMGGMIGQWLAINAASRVRKIVLCNTAARIGSVEGWNGRIATVQNRGFNVIVPDVLERWFTRSFQEGQPDAIAKARAMLATGDPEGYIACCAALRGADYRSSVASIRAPALIIAGTHDMATPPADGRFLADTIGGAQFVELNASHLSNIEAEKKFNAAVLSFLLS